MIRFSSVANMALSLQVNGDFIETGGYSADGDGGGSEYLVKSSVGAGESGVLLASANYAILQGDVTPEKFGALGDGTDDSVAVQAAVDSYPAGGGILSFLTLGVYNFPSVVWGNVAGVFVGSGSPDGVLGGGLGSTYTNLDGGTSNTLYIKESGAGLSGWVAVGSAVIQTTTEYDYAAMTVGVGETTFTLTSSGDVSSLYLSGIYLTPVSDYKVEGTLVTMYLEAVPADSATVVSGNTDGFQTSAESISYTYPTGVLRTVQDRLEDGVSVRDLGIVGLGGDDSAIFQLACNTALNIYVPAGNYLVKNIDLNGAFLHGDGAKTVITDNGSGVDDYTFIDSTTGAAQFKDLTLDGAGGTNVRCAQFNNNTSVVFDNVNVNNYGGRAVYFEQPVTNVNVSGGKCEGNTSEVYVVKSATNTFRGVHFHDSPGHAIRFGRFNGEADVDSGHFSIVDDCQFHDILNNPVLWEINSANGVISNCISNGSRGMYKVDSTAAEGLPSYNVTAIGNRCTNFAGAATAAVFDGDEALNQTIIGNFCDGGYDGINCGAGSVVSGNTIRNVTNQAIRAIGVSIVSGNIIGSGADIGIQAEGANTKIHGNVVNACASRGISCSDGANMSVVGNTCDGSVTNLRMVSTATDSLIDSNVLINAVTDEFIDSSATATIGTNIGIP